MPQSATIHVEFFGIPRTRAGQPTVQLEFESHPVPLTHVIARLGQRFPALAAECLNGEYLRTGYIANINGNTFAGAAATSLRDGDHLLILSADAGG